jgi:hypothetical protein
LDGTYTYEQNGATVDAYIFDTGIRQDHTEFGGRAKPGFDAILAGGTANEETDMAPMWLERSVGQRMDWQKTSRYMQ